MTNNKFNRQEYTIRYVNKYNESVNRIVWAESPDRAVEIWEKTDYAIGATFVSVSGVLEITINTEQKKSLSPEWVLNQLAGMKFPEQDQAYDYMKKCIAVLSNNT